MPNNICKTEQELVLWYEDYRKKKGRLVGALLPVVVVLLVGAVTFGSAEISLGDTLAAFSTGLRGVSETTDPSAVIIWRLRLPRIIVGAVVGIALGVSGAAMQVVLRNPLADPYMLGIASAAGFGASLAIIAGVGIVGGSFLVVGNAFFFAVLSTVLILLFSRRWGAAPERMVLTGLALLFFFQAMTTMVQYFGTSDAVKAAVFWTVGDLGKATWRTVTITAPIVAVGSAILLRHAADLNVMNGGDDGAASLGVHVKRVRVTVMVTAAIMVATVVSFVGTIGFVGLVAPHVVRLVVGTDNKVLLPASGLAGAVLLVFSDAVARTILAPTILPVGSVTAFLGVPLFLYLITRKGGTAL